MAASEIGTGERGASSAAIGEDWPSTRSTMAGGRTSRRRRAGAARPTRVSMAARRRCIGDGLVRVVCVRRVIVSTDWVRGHARPPSTRRAMLKARKRRPVLSAASR